MPEHDPEHDEEHDPEHDEPDDEPVAVGLPVKTRRRWMAGGVERFVIDHGGGDVRRYRSIDVDGHGSNAWTTTRAPK